MLNKTSRFKRARKVFGRGFSQVLEDSKDFKGLGNQLAAEKLPILVDICLLILTLGLRLRGEKLAQIKPIAFTTRIPSKSIEIAQPLIVHIVVQLPISNLIEEIAQVESSTDPGDHSDA